MYYLCTCGCPRAAQNAVRWPSFAHPWFTQ